MYSYYLYVWLDKYNCYWLVNIYSSFASAKKSVAVLKHPNNDFVILKKSFHDGTYNHVSDFIANNKPSFYRVIGTLHETIK